MNRCVTSGKKLAEAEAKGAEGLVDESMAIMEEVEKAKKKKHEAEAHYRNSMPASSYQQQKLRVCEVSPFAHCEAFLGEISCRFTHNFSH